MRQGKSLIFMLFLSAVVISAKTVEKQEINDLSGRTDLETSPTSAKCSLFGQNPSYPYGYNYNTNYPSYRPGYPSNGYYPNTGWTGSNYPNYYGNTGSYYPTSGSYPSTGGYYPGTNYLGGNGGYGGYGGNGGLRQYYGYLNNDYYGQRNRGFGYFPDTDQYGLPQRGYRGSNNIDSGYERERDLVQGAYRGYN